MLSSAKPDKAEAKFAARLDVLTERVDSLATTLATTASAMAKKDGEIAALRKELDARDERLADFITKARETTGGNELRELRNAVAALAKEHSKDKGGGSSRQLDDLTAKVGLLAQRLETISTTVSTTAAGLSGREGELATIRKRLESAPAGAGVVAPDPALIQRVGDLASDVTGTKVQLDGLSAEISGLKSLVEQRSAEPERPSEELREMLGTLHTQVTALAGLRAGVTEEQLAERFAEVDETTSRLSERVDMVASGIESAVASLGDKEHELAALNRHFTESSTRIESIVEDIREALSAFPELGSASVDDLALRVERIESFESASREAADARERGANELTRRIDAIEQQVATVASEVARAKTLWPVALRSLEARLDDVASHARRPELTPVPALDSTDVAGDDVSGDDDLLAGLRDSLHAMENVAAEMARASDALGATDDPTDLHEAVAVAGATIVPLRSPDS